MKFVKRIELSGVPVEMPDITNINIFQIVEEIRIRKEGSRCVVELIIDGEPLEELKADEGKSKSRARGRGELKWEFVNDPRFQEDTIKLTYLLGGKPSWSKYILKRQLDELYNRLPEKAKTAEVFELAKEVGLDGLRQLGAHFLRFLTQLYPDLKVEKVGKKGGGFFYQLVKEKAEDEKKEEKTKELSLGEGAYYRCRGDVVEIRCGPEVICPTWDQLREIFDRLPEKATIGDIQKACEGVIGSVSLDTALALAKFFDRRVEFDCELRPERGLMVLVKGAESEKYGENLKAKFKLEKDLLKDFEQ